MAYNINAAAGARIFSLYTYYGKSKRIEAEIIGFINKIAKANAEKEERKVVGKYDKIETDRERESVELK